MLQCQRFSNACISIGTKKTYVNYEIPLPHGSKYKQPNKRTSPNYRFWGHKSLWEVIILEHSSFSSWIYVDTTTFHNVTVIICFELQYQRSNRACKVHFLAHLAHSAKVSFWDRAVSVVRRRASSVVRRSCVVRRASCVNNLLKHLLLQFHWA